MSEERRRFKQRLQQLQEVIMRAFALYEIWHKLRLHDKNEVSWPLDRQNQVFARWNGFFAPIVIGLQDMALLSFAKVFDSNRRTASLEVLLKEAEQDRNLVPHAGQDDLKLIRERLERAKATLETIKKLRDQRIAHTAAKPEDLQPLMNERIESLCEDIKYGFNQLSAGHDKNIYDWDFALSTSATHTRDVLRLLVNEIELRETAHNEEMVAIVVAHIGDAKTALGHPLDVDELEQAIRSFALTDEQAKTVRERLKA